MTELQQALAAMGRVDFTNIDPVHQATMGSFLERALHEIVQRDAAIGEREIKVSKREADVQVREDRAAAQMTAIASAERLRDQLGFIAPPQKRLSVRGWLRRA